MSLLFNTLSRFVIANLPRKQVCFNFMTAVTICSDFGAQENEIWPRFHCFPIYLQWNDTTQCHDLSFFWMLNFKPTFSLSSSTFIKRLFSSKGKKKRGSLVILQFSKYKGLSYQRCKSQLCWTHLSVFVPCPWPRVLLDIKITLSIFPSVLIYKHIVTEGNWGRSQPNIRPKFIQRRNMCQIT